MTRYTLHLWAVAALGVSQAWAGPLTLDQAIERALQTNPVLAASEAQRDGADAQWRQARAAALPQLSVVGQIGRGTADLGGFFGFERQTVEPRSAQVELRQPLFAGGGVVAGIAQARQTREAAEAAATATRLRISAAAADAYGAVLTNRLLRQQGERYAAATREIARTAALRFEAGEIPRSDLAQAQAREAQGQALLAQAVAQHSAAEARFQEVIGELPDELAPLPAVAGVNGDVAQLQSLAEQASPDLIAARASAEAAQSGLRMAQSERLPSLALTARAGTVRDEFLPGYRSQGNTIALTGKWTLFASGGVSARIDAARAAVRRADAQLTEARNQVRSATAATWSALRAAEAALQAATTQLTASDEALQSLQHEVRVGQRTIVELLNAQRDRLAAATAQAQAHSALTQLQWQLAVLTGQPP